MKFYHIGKQIDECFPFDKEALRLVFRFMQKHPVQETENNVKILPFFFSPTCLLLQFSLFPILNFYFRSFCVLCLIPGCSTFLRLVNFPLLSNMQWFAGFLELSGKNPSFKDGLVLQVPLTT